MKPIVQTSQFKHDLKKVKYAGRYAIDDLLVIVDLLARNQPLPEKHRLVNDSLRKDIEIAKRVAL